MQNTIKRYMTPGIILLIGVLFLPFASCSPQGNQDANHPNIILIMTDDQPPHTLTYMPIIQRELIDKGVNFTNAFVTTPLCCPSRVSILTGQYVHNHGVKTNRAPEGGATALKDEATVAVWLHDAGYRTGYLGKYLNGYNDLPEGYIPPGWDDWQAFYHRDPNLDYYYNYSMNENGKIVEYGTDAKEFSTDLLAERAVQFINGSDQQPFFLVLSIFAPHQTYQAADRHKDMFKTLDEFERYRPPNFFEEDLSDKPVWANEIEHPTVDYVDKVHERMLRSLMSVDDTVGEVTAILDKRGIRDNTMIIYISDNGMSMGDKGVFGKNCPYEACLKIPFIVSYPPLTSTPRVDENSVLNIDIVPTFLDLAGVSIPSIVDGTSLNSLLSNPTTVWRDGFLIEHFEDTSDMEESGLASFIPEYAGFRTAEWKYVEYVTEERELYNLLDDPFEMDNLAYQDGYEGIMNELSQQIQDSLH